MPDLPDRIVLEGEIVPTRTQVEIRGSRPPRRHDIRDSPLWTGEHGLWGRVVTDATEIAAIAARVAHYSRPPWVRWWDRGWARG